MADGYEFEFVFEIEGGERCDLIKLLSHALGRLVGVRASEIVRDEMVLDNAGGGVIAARVQALDQAALFRIAVTEVLEARVGAIRDSGVTVGRERHAKIMRVGREETESGFERRHPGQRVFHQPIHPADDVENVPPVVEGVERHVDLNGIE